MLSVVRELFAGRGLAAHFDGSLPTLAELRDRLCRSRGRKMSPGVRSFGEPDSSKRQSSPLGRSE